MPRIRSIQETYQMLKTDDPNTKVTVGMLRRWVSDGTIPTIRAGRKILLNYDILLAYLSTPSVPISTNTDTEPGAIRPVPLSLK